MGLELTLFLARRTKDTDDGFLVVFRILISVRQVPNIIQNHFFLSRILLDHPIQCGVSPHLQCFLFFSFASSGYQLGCTVATVSAQRPVEHAKNALQNITNEGMPDSVGTDKSITNNLQVPGDEYNRRERRVLLQHLQLGGRAVGDRVPLRHRLQPAALVRVRVQIQVNIFWEILWSESGLICSGHHFQGRHYKRHPRGQCHCGRGQRDGGRRRHDVAEAGRRLHQVWYGEIGNVLKILKL